jgi:predicted Rossmann fold flavoprotein
VLQLNTPTFTTRIVLYCYIAAVKEFDVIVLGGGAAGLMCAIAAGKRGRRVLVLEGSNKIGKKILMSGGGRCNFTNLHCEPDCFLSANPQFCISALSRFTQWDFAAFVEAHGIRYHEKTLGQLFCDGSSREILAMLTAECEQVKVEIQIDAGISGVTKKDNFVVTGARGKFSASSLVIATGGLSIPKMGASDFGYRLAKQFDLAVTETRAGLVPFTFSGSMHELTGRLSGVSVPATLRCAGKSFSEGILFTHRGLSGPAALQSSSYWIPGSDLEIDLFPNDDLQVILLAAKVSHGKALLRTVLGDHLPNSLVSELQQLFWSGLSDRPLIDISDRKIHEIASNLKSWKVRPSGTEGYRTAEVTLGGIDTNELSSKTMESRRVPGLYCIGEVVDVTGHLGGFNFQWAWASGHAAGQVV